MKLAQAIVILVSGCFGFSCEEQKCQAPPPGYNFAFINTQGQSIISNSSQADAVHLVYISSTGVPSSVPQSDFKPVPSNDSYNFVYNVSYDLFAKSEQIQYTVEMDNKMIGMLALRSQRNNSKCDGWMHLTEVRFNDQVVDRRADNVTYAIKINL